MWSTVYNLPLQYINPFYTYSDSNSINKSAFYTYSDSNIINSSQYFSEFYKPIVQNVLNKFRVLTNLNLNNARSYYYPIYGAFLHIFCENK